MSEIKLLLCPFCGGEAEMRRRIVKERNMFYVTCKQEFGCVIGSTRLCDTIEEATRRWNTRKPMERIVEQLIESKEHYRRLWNKNQDDEDYGALSAYENAIDTVKEEGGIE